MASPVLVEEELGRKWDRLCGGMRVIREYYVIGITSLLPTGGGIVLGSVFSLLFFKRRRWPIIMGGGFGVGMAYSNCEKDLNETIRNRSV